ncbi:TRAP transporter large permease [Defluviimonas sp. SAOS-178_SWC]|uniref:TRAP transporter large permease n=1 Tax=Defluviimonas sp. SAOS-178_SWC TaxID=3121287 RepID=UPI003222035E
MTSLLIVACLVCGLLISLPIFVVFAATAFITFGLTSEIPLSILPQRISAGLESFTLLAIPFFFLAAQIMSRGGLSDRLIAFVQTLVGHLPGGLGMTVVLTCMLFGSITGSSASTIVAVGTILVPALTKSGYSPQFAIGSVTCSALIGMLIPPSNAMIIYAAVANVSIGALFMSGIGAGLLFSFAYCAYCVGYAQIAGVPRSPRANLSQIIAAAREVVWGVGMPIVILGGVYGGVFTATEASVVAVFYAAFVGMVVYRQINLSDLWEICIDSGIASSRVLILVAAASLFSWLMSISGTTAAMAAPLRSFSGEPSLILLATNALLLVGGMVVDVYSNLLIMAPVILGPAGAAGINTTHLGVVMVVNVDIGNITPPFGLNLFVAAAAFGLPYFSIVRAVLPWLAISLVCLIVITYVPAIPMWLPERLYP